jgi:hypothetical protein
MNGSGQPIGGPAAFPAPAKPVIMCHDPSRFRGRIPLPGPYPPSATHRYSAQSSRSRACDKVRSVKSTEATEWRSPLRPKNLRLMRPLPTHLNGRQPINRDPHETDGLLGTEIVRRKTDENLGTELPGRSTNPISEATASVGDSVNSGHSVVRNFVEHNVGETSHT